MFQTDICIIGGGAAGLMTAAQASEAGGCQTIVVESNSAAGRKLLLTGGKRCNFTHFAKADEIIRRFKPSADRFVRHCIYSFGSEKIIEFFDKQGLKSKTDNDGNVFPETNRASDVKQVLITLLKKNNVKILYSTAANEIIKTESAFEIKTDKFLINSNAVIIATGGVSWPQTGSTGDGYKFAAKFGHKIIEPKPALVPLITKERWVKNLAGVAVAKVKIKSGKMFAQGAMLFTHSGIGGPAVLDFSRKITDNLAQPLEVSIDLLPNLNSEVLKQSFLKNPKQKIISVVCQHLPKNLAKYICDKFELADIAGGQLSRKKLNLLVSEIKDLELTIIAAGAIEKAIITAGGVDTAEIDDKTMASKKCLGLFLAGEVLNVDAPCGGYNLTFAFSSGFLAAKSAVEFVSKIK